MEGDILNNNYSKLLTNIDFERLDLILKKPNIFSALNISNYEIRHSNFLAWLLDPKGNHGLGDIFLKRILIDVLSDKRAKKVNTVDIPSLIKQSINVHREWSNIDIVIEFEDTVIAIENKIHSSEHSNQLARYFKIVEEHFVNKRQIFCYLTPLGLEASMNDNYIELGYSTIISHLEDIYHIYQTSLNSKVQFYIQDYIENLKLNIMGDHEANELAKKIYNNHKDLLEFIFAHRPDAASDFLPLITTFLKQRGYAIGSPNKGVVRFLSPEIFSFLKPYDKNFGGFPNKEPFMFEIDFFWIPGKIQFKAIATPSDYPIKDCLLSVLDEVDGAKKPSGKKWATYFITKQNFNLPELLEKSEAEVFLELEKLTKMLWPIVEKVENRILEHREKLTNSINY